MSKQTDFNRLIQEKAELDAKIQAMRAEARSGAIVEIKRKIAAFELTAAELGFNKRAYLRKETMGKQRSAVAPKYRDPESGKTWSGRGRLPLWISGKDRDGFLIA